MKTLLQSVSECMHIGHRDARNISKSLLLFCIVFIINITPLSLAHAENSLVDIQYLNELDEQVCNVQEKNNNIAESNGGTGYQGDHTYSQYLSNYSTKPKELQRWSDIIWKENSSLIKTETKNGAVVSKETSEEIATKMAKNQFYEDVLRLFWDEMLPRSPTAAANDLYRLASHEDFDAFFKIIVDSKKINEVEKINVSLILAKYSDLLIADYTDVQKKMVFAAKEMVGECVAKKIKFILYPKDIGGIAGDIAENGLAPLSGVLDLFQGQPTDIGTFTLEESGLEIVIATEAANIVSDMLEMDTNGLSEGQPIRWYIDSYELWDQAQGHRYKYPLANIPIAEGIMKFDVRAKRNDSTGNLLGGLDILGLDIDPEIVFQLNIEDNYITNIQVSKKVDVIDSAIKIANFVEKRSVEIALTLGNGVKANIVALGDTWSIDGEPRMATAEGLSSFKPDDIAGISDEDSLLNFIVQFTNWLLGFVGAIGVLMIIYAGILMLWDRGDGDFSKKGLQIIRWVVFGIIIIIVAYTVVNTVIRLGGPQYEVAFEIRDSAGGKIIGVEIVEGNCATTTLPLVGEIDICNKEGYYTVESDSPILPDMLWPIPTFRGGCKEIVGGIHACLNAPDGRPDRFVR